MSEPQRGRSPRRSRSVSGAARRGTAGRRSATPTRGRSIGRQTRSTSSNLGSASIRAHQTGIDTGDLPAADPRGESLRSRAEDNSSDESSTDSNTGGSAQDQEEQVDMTSAATSGPYKLRATQRTATEVESTIVILPRDQRPKDPVKLVKIRNEATAAPEDHLLIDMVTVEDVIARASKQKEAGEDLTDLYQQSQAKWKDLEHRVKQWDIGMLFRMRIRSGAMIAILCANFSWCFC